MELCQKRKSSEEMSDSLKLVLSKHKFKLNLKSWKKQ